MPQFFIQATNSTFRSRDQGDEYDHPDIALALGIRTQVLRSIVAVSVSAMLPTVHPFKLTVV